VCSAVGYLAIHVEGRRGRRRPRELVRSAESFVAQPVPPWPYRFGNASGDGRRLPGIGQYGGATGDFRHGAGIRGHDGAAARHGLENGEPESLVERRIHEHVGRPVEVDGLLKRDPADEDQICRDPEFSGERVELGDVPLVPSGADDRQLAIPQLAPQLTPGQRPGPQQSVTILVPPQRRHEQYERLRDPVVCDPRASRTSIAGLKEVMVDRLVDQLELASIDVEVLLDL
jgi:hypothetical protein